MSTVDVEGEHLVQTKTNADGMTSHQSSRFKQRSKRICKSSLAPLIVQWRASVACFRHMKQAFMRWFEKLGLVVWFSIKFPGWQAGVVLGIALAIFALCSNLGFLIFAYLKHKPGENGLGTIQEGDCTKIDIWNKVAHGFINVGSTLLLMQSNYCMQLLASPSRHDVDVAHARKKWVDIGIPSFRNVWNRNISPWRCFWWLLLAVSSAPLHLLWNSVIIFSPSAFRYNQLTVTEGFVRGLPFNDNEYISFAITDGDYTHWPDNLHILQKNLQHNLQSYERLSNLECKRRYAQSFVRDRSDVIVVTTPKIEETNTSQVLGASIGGYGPWPFAWLCPSEVNRNFKCYDHLFQTRENWTFPDYDNPQVQFCVSKPMPQRCKLEYGFWITIYTIIANCLKLVCFVVTFRMVKNCSTKRENNSGDTEKDHTLLITSGDAIASFLKRPDKETAGMSIVEKVDFQNGIWDLRWVSVNPILWRKRGRCAWFRAIGLQRWLTGNALLSTITLAPGMFLLVKYSWLKNDLELNASSIKQLGIGNPSALFLFGEWSSGNHVTSWNILENVALANTPQLAVSAAYYLWNSHLTAMVAAEEYGNYAAPPKDKYGAVGTPDRQSLRLMSPQKETDQQSTHLLTIPVRYGIPNAVLWAALHYLASQAVFFARIDVLDHWLEPSVWSINQVGYSVLGLICFFILALFVLVCALCIGLFRLNNRMPLAATCSGALSAACHPKDISIKHHEKKVHWGIELAADEAGEDLGFYSGQKIRHCTFTSGKAYYPEENTFYA